VRLANAFGSPNILTTTHICTWNRGFGSKYTYGVSTPTPDYEHTSCMLLWGYNPQVSEPAAAMRISQAQARGARLIVIDPRRNSLAQKADLWLKVRPGSDGALALAMINVLLEEGLYDAAFVRAWTNGSLLVREDTQRLLTERDLVPAGDPDTFVAWDGGTNTPVGYHPEQGYEHAGVTPELTGSFAVTLVDGQIVPCRPAFQLLSDLAAEYAPELSEALTWVPASDVRQAARLFAMEKPSCYSSWVGLEQHASAMQTNRAVCVFYTLTGQFDQRGSNVVFAGVPIQPITGTELLPAQQVARRLGLGEHPLGPQRDPGVVQAADVYRAALTSQPYPVKAMVLFGSDPLLGQGDPVRGKAALEELDFYVHMDMFANPSALFADILLPASTCWEHGALMPGFRKSESAATWAQFREAVVQPMYEARSDLEVIFDLATRMGLGDQFFGGDIEAAFNYELAPSGLTVQQLRDHPGGMHAEGKTTYQKYSEIIPGTGRPRGFQTPTRKVEIYSTAFARAGYAALPIREGPVEGHAGAPSTVHQYPLVLTFARLLPFIDQQHRNIPRLRRQARPRT
jgi:anaerobic selenocysteine-containing dehydrogenase